MKIKLSLLAFISVSAFAGVHTNSRGTCNTATGYYADGYVSSASDKLWTETNIGIGKIIAPHGTVGCDRTQYTVYLTTGTYYTHYCLTTVSADQACPSCFGGATYNGDTQGCVAPDLSAYNNNVTACHDHGGLLLQEGTSSNCYPYSVFASKILASPSSIVGGGFFVNGLLFTSAGLVGAGLGGGLAASAFATVGAYAMLIGAGTAIFGNADAITSNLTPTPSNDVMATPTDRIKVSLDAYQNTQVATADTATGKVKEISTIPPEVKQRIIDGVVNPTTGQSNLTPASLAGVKSTSFDYVANVATTKTVQPSGAITTTTTPIVTQTNPTTGAVTTYAFDPTVAPTVTGTKATPQGNPNWSNYTTIAQWTETTGDAPVGTGAGTIPSTQTGGGTGGTSADGTSAGTGTNSATGASEETFGALTADDGSGGFGSLTDSLTDKYGAFQQTNPLGLTCSNTIQTYSFILMGRTFILFDKALVDKLPVDLIKNIFLFVAAVGGLIFTFAGGA